MTNKHCVRSNQTSCLSVDLLQRTLLQFIWCDRLTFYEVQVPSQSKKKRTRCFKFSEKLTVSYVCKEDTAILQCASFLGKGQRAAEKVYKSAQTFVVVGFSFRSHYVRL